MVDYLQETYSSDDGDIQDLAVLYPDIPQIGIPATYSGRSNVQGELAQVGPRCYA